MREVLIKCSRCHDEYPSSDMRYISSNVMCCKNCIERPETQPKIEKKVNKPEYLCTKCKYSFKSNVFPNSCPYCGKRDSVVVKKGVSADKLLSESTDRRYD